MSIGNLLIIGGSEDKTGDCKILRHFANAVGGQSGYAIILTTAAEEAVGEAGKTYVETFHRLGIGKADVLNINSRDDANLEICETMIANATGIFFTGGDQLRITSIIGGTRLLKALHGAYARGTIIAGTSAGASAMSSTMIVDGNGNEPARKCTLKMAPGLKLLDGVLIDQHFHQRGRIGRLLGGVAENPEILGIGIDEDTAVRTYPDGYMEVVGSYSVTIVDGREIKSSNVSELKPDENLAIINVKIHVLPEGYGLDFRQRKVQRHHP